MGFLFGAIPLLFIPCLLIGQALDTLRYAFIALCVAGLGVMWYRQMFSASTRVTVSIIYAALCVVAVSTLLASDIDILKDEGANLDARSSAAPTVLTAMDIAPEDTPPPVSPYGPSEAEKQLSTFMELWIRSEVEEMIFYVQPSWVRAKANPAASLFQDVLINRTPLDYEIESVSGADADTTRSAVMTASITKNNNKTPVRYRFTILMVKEDGGWFVDPSTLSTNDIEPTPDGVTVTATKEQPTLQPRMTETPVPAPNTTLYYNPNNGSFYHRDPNCGSVDSQYLPLQGFFLYSELRTYGQEYSGKLMPCLKCDAPVKALPLPQSEGP